MERSIRGDASASAFRHAPGRTFALDTEAHEYDHNSAFRPASPHNRAEGPAAAVALVFFLPLLIDSGGNAGSQAATLVVRALATGDVHLRGWFLLLRKELTVAATMGVATGVAVSLVGIVRAPEVTVVVAITMVLIVIVGSLIGMSLPFVFTRLGWDPATASAPLITSLSDISGVLIYFSVASWYLGLQP
jgi:magnesium transporter